MWFISSCIVNRFLISPFENLSLFHHQVSLCNGGRDETSSPDRARAQNDAKALYQAGAARLGTDESSFNRVLCAQSPAQLQLVFEEWVHVLNSTTTYNEEQHPTTTFNIPQQKLSAIRTLNDNSNNHYMLEQRRDSWRSWMEMNEPFLSCRNDLWYLLVASLSTMDLRNRQDVFWITPSFSSVWHSPFVLKSRPNH